MNIDLARHMVRTHFRCARELEDLMSLLKSQLPQAEYKEYAHSIATVIASMGEALVNKATAAFPELDQEIEQSIAKYDRYL